MEALRRYAVALVVLAILAVVASFLFAASFTLFAVIAPVIGVGYVMLRWNAALALWRSHGHIPLVEGVRVIGAGRARVLAILSALEGAAGLALSLVLTSFVFGHRMGALLLLGAGAAAHVGSSMARRKVIETGHVVDVLPPER